VLQNYKLENYRWLGTLIHKIEKVGYKQISPVYENIPCLSFHNPVTTQTINYFYDLIFPEMVNNPLLREIGQVNMLIVIGHTPHKKVLKYMKGNFDFVGKTGTHYGYYDDEDELFNDDFTERVEKWIYLKEAKDFDYEYSEGERLERKEVSGLKEMEKRSRDDYIDF
jgi:hypothetical protein